MLFSCYKLNLVLTSHLFIIVLVSGNVDSSAKYAFLLTLISPLLAVLPGVGLSAVGLLDLQSKLAFSDAMSETD